MVNLQVALQKAADVLFWEGRLDSSWVKATTEEYQHKVNQRLAKAVAQTAVTEVLAAVYETTIGSITVGLTLRLVEMFEEAHTEVDKLMAPTAYGSVVACRTGRAMDFNGDCTVEEAIEALRSIGGTEYGVDWIYGGDLDIEECNIVLGARMYLGKDAVRQILAEA